MMVFSLDNRSAAGQRLLLSVRSAGPVSVARSRSLVLSTLILSSENNAQYQHNRHTRAQAGAKSLVQLSAKGALMLLRSA